MTPPTNPFVSVRLCTRDAQLVEVLMMPAFNRLPEVILWGTRHFGRSESAFALGILEYREVFCWAAPPGAEQQGACGTCGGDLPSGQ